MRDKIKEILIRLILFLRRKDLLNKFISFVKSHKNISIAIIAILLIMVIVSANVFSHVGTYVCTSDGSGHKIVLRLNGTYSKSGEGKGTYKISKYKVALTPRDSDAKKSTLLREGNYLYVSRGWDADDSPYFNQKLSKGKKINQTLSYDTYSVVSTFVGNFRITIHQELKLNKDGTYIYTYNSDNNGTKHNNTEIGIYKRTKRELVLTNENGLKKSLPIVDNKVVYVDAYKKR